MMIYKEHQCVIVVGDVVTIHRGVEVDLKCSMSLNVGKVVDVYIG